MNGAAIRNGRIWRLLKVVLMSMAALVGGLVAPVTYNLFTTSRYNAAYPIPSISCGCGFREYFMLNEDRDRLVMWNAGHNLKREYFYARPSSRAGRFELEYPAHQHTGFVEFHWLWIDMQWDPYGRQRVYRQLNWIELLYERFYAWKDGSGPDYQTFEEIRLQN